MEMTLEYVEAKIVIMFGGLHIVLAALKTLGDLLKCSRWTSALVYAGVATAGTADSFLTAAHITCTRRAHQVTACVLYQALEEAHQEYVLSTEPGMEDESLEHWCNQQSSLPMLNFWFTVLQLQLTLLVFVRSIRTGVFKHLCPITCALVLLFRPLQQFMMDISSPS